MRNTLLTVCFAAIALITSSISLALWHASDVRDRALERTLESAALREAELTKHAKELTDTNARVMAALGRIILLEEEKHKSGADLARRLSVVETALASLTMADAQKVDREIQAMRQQTQAAFTEVGAALAKMSQELQRQSASR